MLKHIVVAVDDASAYESEGCALQCAGTLARQLGGDVALLHVQPPVADDQATITPYQYEGVVDTRRVEQREHLAGTASALEEMEERVKEWWGVAAEGRVAHGEPHRTLRRAIESLNGDLLIARAGEERCSSAYLARLPDDVIRYAQIPVLFVPGGPCRLTEGVHRVLVPLDGSPGAEEILPLAVRLPGENGALNLLTVVPPSTRIESLRRRGATALRSRAAAERYLQSVTNWPDLKDLQVQWNVVEGVSAEQGIRDEAERTQCDLVAMSTRAHDGLSGMLLGNVTREVLRTTRVPLLVHRAGSAPIAA